MSTIRRMFTHDEKISILSRLLKEGVSISGLARVNNINPITLDSWKRKMSEKTDKNDQINVKKILEENAKLPKRNKSLKKSLVSKFLVLILTLWDWIF